MRRAVLFLCRSLSLLCLLLTLAATVRSIAAPAPLPRRGGVTQPPFMPGRYVCTLENGNARPWVITHDFRTGGGYVRHFDRTHCGTWTLAGKVITVVWYDEHGRYSEDFVIESATKLRWRDCDAIWNMSLAEGGR